jgi:hypothetical protein
MRVARRASFSRLLLLLSRVSLALLVSCASTPEQAIIGKWKLTTGADTIELFPDGTLISVERGIPAQGTYSFLDATRVEIELDELWGITGPFVFQVWLPGDELILTLPKVGTKKYRRVKEGR